MPSVWPRAVRVSALVFCVRWCCLGARRLDMQPWLWTHAHCIASVRTCTWSVSGLLCNVVGYRSCVRFRSYWKRQASVIRRPLPLALSPDLPLRAKSSAWVFLRPCSDSVVVRSVVCALTSQSLQSVAAAVTLFPPGCFVPLEPCVRSFELLTIKLPKSSRLVRCPVHSLEAPEDLRSSSPFVLRGCALRVRPSRPCACMYCLHGFMLS